jgi:hypothetical protein
MNETFGTRLRLQRERQQIDLTAISANTKISVSLLERLERDDVQHWPVGIFRRAYIRAYATAIGLDPEAVLREFLERYPDPKALDPFSAAEVQAAEDAARPGGNRLGKIVRSAMAGLMRPSRPEMSRQLAMESADDRESWDHEESFEPAQAAAARREEREEIDHTRVDPPDTGRPAPASAEATDRIAGGYEHYVYDPGIRRHEQVPDAAGHRLEQRRWREPDLMAAAALCTRFAQVREWNEVDALLGEAARMLDAVGLVVWAHTGRGDTLAAVLAHGYPPAMLARMPVVPRTADNAIAAAFRSVQRSVVAGEDGRPGALVVPLLAATGCAGVLALELTHGAEQSDGVTAFAEIVAAQIAPLLGATPAAEAVSA